MTKEEALAFDLALEALESCTPEDTSTGHVVWPSYDEQAVEQAITAIKQARSAPVQSCYCPNCEAMGKELAALKAQPAPVQEPVAWHDKIIGMEVSMDVSTGDDDIDHRVYGQVYEVMLAYDGGPDVILAIESERNFTTPPTQPAPVQEPQRYSPDGEGGMEVDSLGAYVKLQDVTTPPAAQRQWVGLTDEEYFEIGQRHSVTSTKIELIHAEIEAKLKEKNQ